jgi:hypothetical protein
MPGLDDYRMPDGSRIPTDAPPGRSRRAIIWTLAAIGAIALGVILWLLFRPPAIEPQSASAPPSVAQTTQEVEAAKPTGPLPPLDGSDAIVRTVVKALSSRPELATWLANDELVRAFVTIVDNIARGVSPKSFLSDFTPQQPFRAAGSGTRFRTDPRSFTRYNGAAEAFASLDAPGVARAYQQLGPLCETAYRELGVPGTFREALERAIGRLLAVPDVAADAPLTWNYATYQYADERLESLPAAERQLLRMGPRNVGLVKEKLKELAIAMRLVPRTPTS